VQLAVALTTAAARKLFARTGWVLPRWGGASSNQLKSVLKVPGGSAGNLVMIDRFQVWLSISTCVTTRRTLSFFFALLNVLLTHGRGVIENKHLRTST